VYVSKVHDVDVQVIDFFSGCGGMSFGFATTDPPMIRYRVIGAVDIDRHANATYGRMLGIQPLECDIRELASADRIDDVTRTWGLTPDQPLVVIGCAPCQGFSSHRKKDDRVDSRNQLLNAFAAIIIKLRPEVIVMENVPEMLHLKYWPFFAQWRRTLEQAGYMVRARIYNLAEFGVPQERFRALVLASRWPYIGMPSPTHKPDDFVTVRNAIGTLPALSAGGRDPADPMHITSRHRKETIELIRMIPRDGGSRRSLPQGVGPQCLSRVDGFRDVYGRLAWDKPSVAITARCRTPSCGRFIHPEQHRGLSVREAALLQGFPPEYYFDGPFDDKYKQIGNAVSPIFAAHVAQHVASEWATSHVVPAEPDFYMDVAEPLMKSFSSSIAHIKRSRVVR
jgi:DNA (cytosine-5)-methyltransferase 1